MNDIEARLKKLEDCVHHKFAWVQTDQLDQERRISLIEKYLKKEPVTFRDLQWNKLMKFLRLK